MKRGFYLLVGVFLFSCSSPSKPKCEGESTGLPAEALLVAEEDDFLDIVNLEGRRDTLLIDPTNIPNRTYESGFNFARSFEYDVQDKKAHMVLVPFSKEGNDFTEALAASKPSYKSDKLKIYRDVWAKPQMVIQIEAEDFKLSWSKLSGQVLDSFRAFEMGTGLRGFYAGNQSTILFGDIIENTLGVRFQIPPQFQPQKTDSSIVWFTQNANAFYQHVVVSSIAKNQAPTGLEQAISQREDFINAHLKNQEGTRIIVSKSPYFIKRLETVRIAGVNCQRLIGWYAEEGTFRRGIFHRYYFPKEDRIVVFDAFAFAPNMPKSRFNRLFEIIANTYRG